MVSRETWTEHRTVMGTLKRMVSIERRKGDQKYGEKILGSAVTRQ